MTGDGREMPQDAEGDLKAGGVAGRFSTNPVPEGNALTGTIASRNAAMQAEGLSPFGRPETIDCAPARTPLSPNLVSNSFIEPITPGSNPRGLDGVAAIRWFETRSVETISPVPAQMASPPIPPMLAASMVRKTSLPEPPAPAENRDRLEADSSETVPVPPEAREEF